MTASRPIPDLTASARALRLGRRTLVLVMFVLAAAPVVSLAKGLELAALIHATSREGHRRAPAIDAARAVIAVRAVAEAPAMHECPARMAADRRVVPPTTDDRASLRHGVRVALLALPPPIAA